MSTVGKNILTLRKELGWTQEELANRMGYKSKSTINKIELGINDIPQSKIVQFAEILGTTPAYLMGWDDVPKHRPRKKEYTYDNENACCTEEENPLLLKIYKCLETFSQDQLEAELEHLKNIDEGKKNCNDTISTVADLSQREIQVARAYRNQNDAIKNAIDKILDLSFLE